MPGQEPFPKKLIDRLNWERDWGAYFLPELPVGGTDHPGQNPPALSGLALVAWSFYFQTATEFVKEFDLMASRIRSLGLGATEEDLLVQMLSILRSRKRRNAGRED